MANKLVCQTSFDETRIAAGDPDHNNDGGLFAATWHFFWTRPDWADRFLVEPLESRYRRASISSLDSFTFQLLLKRVASRFAKAQIAPGKVAITYPRWRRSLKVSSCLHARLLGLDIEVTVVPGGDREPASGALLRRPLSGGGQSMCILGRRTDAALKGRANARKERL